MRTLRTIALAAVLFAAGAVMAEDAPDFMKNTYPEQAVESAVNEMKALEGEDAALSAKMRELISLGVAAQIPCTYCVYYHTKAAKIAGATDAEIKESLAVAAQVRKWSTILNGSLYDEEAFRKEVDAIFSGD
jgi:AhpD family alkylhydroperoxidase